MLFKLKHDDERNLKSTVVLHRHCLHASSKACMLCAACVASESAHARYTHSPQHDIDLHNRQTPCVHRFQMSRSGGILQYQQIASAAFSPAAASGQLLQAAPAHQPCSCSLPSLACAAAAPHYAAPWTSATWAALLLPPACRSHCNQQAPEAPAGCCRGCTVQM